MHCQLLCDTHYHRDSLFGAFGFVTVYERGVRRKTYHINDGEHGGRARCIRSDENKQKHGVHCAWRSEGQLDHGRTRWDSQDSMRMLITRVRLVPLETELTDAVCRWMLHILYAINAVQRRVSSQYNGTTTEGHSPVQITFRLSVSE